MPARLLPLICLCHATLSCHAAAIRRLMLATSAGRQDKICRYYAYAQLCRCCYDAAPLLRFCREEEHERSGWRSITVFATRLRVMSTATPLFLMLPCHCCRRHAAACLHMLRQRVDAARCCCWRAMPPLLPLCYAFYADARHMRCYSMARYYAPFAAYAVDMLPRRIDVAAAPPSSALALRV